MLKTHILFHRGGQNTRVTHLCFLAEVSSGAHRLTHPPRLHQKPSSPLGRQRLSGLLRLSPPLSRCRRHFRHRPHLRCYAGESPPRPGEESQASPTPEGSDAPSLQQGKPPPPPHSPSWASKQDYPENRAKKTLQPPMPLPVPLAGRHGEVSVSAAARCPGRRVATDRNPLVLEKIRSRGLRLRRHHLSSQGCRCHRG